MLLGNTYNERVDCFSLAVVLWELQTGDAPWPPSVKAGEIAYRVAQEQKRPIIPEHTWATIVTQHIPLGP